MRLLAGYLYKVGTNCLAGFTKKQGFSNLVEKKKNLPRYRWWFMSRINNKQHLLNP